MKKKALLLLTSLTLLSCTKTAKNEAFVADQKIDSLAVKDTAVASATQNWYDGLIADYIQKSDNKLIKSALKNNEHIEWLLDRTEATDSTHYYIFNIGQDVTDENHTNPRFATNGWIYVDSISKKIYEYDIPNDTLVLWENKHNR